MEEPEPVKKATTYTVSKTKRLVASNPAEAVVGTVSAPDMNLPIDDIKNLRITKFHTWNPDEWVIGSLGFTLSDSTTTIFDNYCRVNQTYNLLPNLTQIEVGFNKDDRFIGSLTFTYADGTSKQLGKSGDKERVEIVKIGNDEHLAGAEIDHGEKYVIGLTFFIVKRQL